MKQLWLGLFVLAAVLAAGYLVWNNVRAPGYSANSSFKKLEGALRSSDFKVRLSAVKELLTRSDDESAKLLEKAANDRATVIRVAIVQGIKRFSEKQAAPILLKLLDDRESGIVRDAIRYSEELTGEKYGFKPGETLESNREAIQRCKADLQRRLSEK